MTGRPDLSKGVVCRLEGPDSDGKFHSAALKAYGALGGEATLKWELRYLLPKLGFNEEGSKKMWRHLSDNWPRWENTLAHLQISPADHMGKSRCALARTTEAESLLESAEQDHWISAPALVALLAAWVHQRRRKRDQQLASCFGNLLFARCLGPEECSPLLGWRVPEQVSGACPKVKGGGRSCMCLQSLLESNLLVGRQLKAQSVVFEKITLLSKFSVCPAAAMRCKEMICNAAAIIKNNISDWGVFDWHLSSDCLVSSEKKRRRVDHHLKQHALSQQVVGSAATVTLAAKPIQGVDCAQLLLWLGIEMSSYRAHTIMDLKECNVLCVAIDAAQVGQPTRELLCGLFSDTAKGRHGALPPQVPLLARRGGSWPPFLPEAARGLKGFRARLRVASGGTGPLRSGRRVPQTFPGGVGGGGSIIDISFLCFSRNEKSISDSPPVHVNSPLRVPKGVAEQITNRRLVRALGALRLLPSLVGSS